jgi:hypothetical protein
MKHGGLVVDGLLPAEGTAFDRLKGTGDGVIDGGNDLGQVVLEEAPFGGRGATIANRSSSDSARGFGALLPRVLDLVGDAAILAAQSVQDLGAAGLPVREELQMSR